MREFTQKTFLSFCFVFLSESVYEIMKNEAKISSKDRKLCTSPMPQFQNAANGPKFTNLRRLEKTSSKYPPRLIRESDINLFKNSQNL